MDMRNRIGLYGSYFLGTAAIGFTLPYLPLYLGAKGLSDGAIGIVSTLAALSALAQFPVGLWSDRIGWRKPFLVGALAVTALSTVLIRGAHGVVWLGVLVVMFAENGIGRAVVESLSGAEAAALAPKRGVGAALGALRFWKPIGIVIVALVGRMLAYAFVVSMVAWIFVVWPAGWLADRCGRKPLLVVGWAIMTARLALVSLVQNPWLAVASQGLDGLGNGLFAVLAAAWVTDRLADPRRSGEAQVIVGSCLVFGSALGPAAAAFLVGPLGYRGLFAASAGVGAVATAIVVFFVPETLALNDKIIEGRVVDAMATTSVLSTAP
jgi:MFS family permease